MKVGWCDTHLALWDLAKEIPIITYNPLSKSPIALTSAPLPRLLIFT